MPQEPLSNEQNTRPSFSLSDHPHAGAILAVLIILLALILGGIYLWGTLVDHDGNQARVERAIPNNEPETPRAQVDQKILTTTSSSVDLDAITADLESTPLNDLDADLNQIEAELNAALR